MEDKKRRAYIIGQTKGFDAKERFETAEKFLRGFGLEVFNPESFERYISGFTKDDEEIEDFKLWYIKECMNRVRRLQEHTERQESEVLIWHMSRKEYKNA